MSRRSLGLIETVGLVAAVSAADTAVKAANVTLLGYELVKGEGLTVVKLRGDVEAVKAAVAAAEAAALRLGHIVTTHVIALPVHDLSLIVDSAETVGSSPLAVTNMPEQRLPIQPDASDPEVSGEVEPNMPLPVDPLPEDPLSAGPAPEQSVPKQSASEKIAAESPVPKATGADVGAASVPPSRGSRPGRGPKHR